MVQDWDCLSDELQITIGQEALRRATDTLASQAEQLACEIESGLLRDKGGPDALRLLAALMRAMCNDPWIGAGLT
jgi:hypothetical protein